MREPNACHAQPWLARPTMAGWWVVWLTQDKRPETLEVSELDGQMIVYFGELFVIEDIRDEFGGWAGPIKSPGAWDEDTQSIHPAPPTLTNPKTVSTSKKSPKPRQ